MARFQALSQESRATFWRSLGTLNITRAVIAAVLLAYAVLGPATGRPVAWLYTEACMAYLAFALGFAALTYFVRRRFLLQLMTQVAVDIAIISTLYVVAGGLRSGLAILYLFPLAGAAILAPLLLALFCASVVALFMLAETTYKVFIADGDIPYLQTGLYGAAYFAAVFVVNRLAAKLIWQEELAVRRGVDLAIQQAVNEIVMADMGDGVLVTGRDGHVFAANPAARRMLGLGPVGGGFLLAAAPALEPILAAFQAWIDDPDGQRVAFVHIKPVADAGGAGAPVWSGRRGTSAHLQLRFARAHTPDPASDRCVIFLQDVSAIENQAQELKLASMGRLTASIAHEVRNPLSAISHATSLLAEDLVEKPHKRLLKIVGDNVGRVNRMVEDILQLSRKVQPHGEPVHLQAFLAEVVAEFQETHKLADGIVAFEARSNPAVRFDPLHLREVIANLLNNAVRYASGAPGSIRLYAVSDGRTELHVQDDGPGITPDVRAHLFEPFYTTSSKGTGLGLYLARELCMNNHANLDYEYRFDGMHGNQRKASGRFVITFGQRNGI
ncbi:sensor histidine kinase [Pseudoduganella sp. GCM10020061]|uniref:sensor histidine kinase n=1 Tax=Pseudoduganella sp. GCM10020061 TaxID=3317345 RepID=UPI0036285B73